MIWVVTQLILFGLIALIPSDQDFEAPRIALITSFMLAIIGLAIGILAIYNLRRSLSVAPAPTEDGQLQTRGIYGFIRHPMYVSVWLVVLGYVVWSGSWLKFSIYVGLIVFFALKVRHEEKLLLAKYPDYRKYSNNVGAFIPKIRH